MAEKTEAAKTDNKTKVRTPVYPRGCTTKNLNLVVEIFDNAKVPAREKADGSMTTPGHFVNFELSQIPEVPSGLTKEPYPQLNASLVTKERVGEDGKKTYSTGQFYTDAEMESIRAAIGDKGQPIYKHEANEAGERVQVGEPIGVVGVVSGDVIIASNKVNHKSLRGYEGPLPESIQTAQFEGNKAARAAALESIAKSKEAKAAKSSKSAEAPAAEAPEASTDEPSFA